MLMTRYCLIALVAIVGTLAACGSDDSTERSDFDKTSQAGNGNQNSAGGSNTIPNPGSGGGQTQNPGGNTNVSRNGVTSCGNFGGSEKTCLAGQYCRDELFSECENGCLSDGNCADTQACVKASGAQVGSCQNNPSAATTCDKLCAKMALCSEQSISDEQCSAVCTAIDVDVCYSCAAQASCDFLQFGCDIDCEKAGLFAKE